MQREFAIGKGVVKAVESDKLSKAMTCKGPVTSQEAARSLSGSPPLMGEAVSCVRSMTVAPKWTTGATTTKQCD